MVHTSVDSFFVAGKEYMASPSIDSSVPVQVSHEDTPVTLHTSGSADTLLDTDVQDLPVDPLEELAFLMMILLKLLKCVLMILSQKKKYLSKKDF